MKQIRSDVEARVELLVIFCRVCASIVLIGLILNYEETTLYPIMATWIVGILLGSLIYNLILGTLGLLSQYVPSLRGQTSQLSRHCGAIGLLIWMFLYFSDEEGLLLIHGCGIYMVVIFYDEILSIVKSVLTRQLTYQQQGTVSGQKVDSVELPDEKVRPIKK